MGVPLELSGRWKPGPAVKVIGEKPYYYWPAAGIISRTYDVSADGRRFLMIKSIEPAASSSLFVVQHFDDELKRLVPLN